VIRGGCKAQKKRDVVDEMFGKVEGVGWDGLYLGIGEL
jgi:hypothetical protein